MQHWIITTLMGAVLGLTLFACVRLRMYIGPVIRQRYGNGYRRAYWLLTIIVMVALSNGGLRLVRMLTHDTRPTNDLWLEIWFATLALVIPLTLIYRRIHRND